MIAQNLTSNRFEKDLESAQEINQKSNLAKRKDIPNVSLPNPGQPFMVKDLTFKKLSEYISVGLDVLHV